MTATVPAIMESYGFSLAKAAQRLVQACEPELAAHGITARHVGMLRTIAEQGPISQKALGDLHRIDRTTMVTLTDELASAGLIHRTRAENDRRSNLLSISTYGASKLQRGWSVVQRAELQALSMLTEKEQAQLKKLLLKIMEGVPT